MSDKKIKYINNDSEICMYKSMRLFQKNFILSVPNIIISMSISNYSNFNNKFNLFNKKMLMKIKTFTVHLTKQFILKLWKIKENLLIQIIKLGEYKLKLNNNLLALSILFIEIIQDKWIYKKQDKKNKNNQMLSL